MAFNKRPNRLSLGIGRKNVNFRAPRSADLNAAEPDDSTESAARVQTPSRLTRDSDTTAGGETQNPDTSYALQTKDVSCNTREGDAQHLTVEGDEPKPLALDCKAPYSLTECRATSSSTYERRKDHPLDSSAARPKLAAKADPNCEDVKPDSESASRHKRQKSKSRSYAAMPKLRQTKLTYYEDVEPDSEPECVAVTRQKRRKADPSRARTTTAPTCGTEHYITLNTSSENEDDISRAGVTRARQSPNRMKIVRVGTDMTNRKNVSQTPITAATQRPEEDCIVIDTDSETDNCPFSERAITLAKSSTLTLDKDTHAEEGPSSEPNPNPTVAPSCTVHDKVTVERETSNDDFWEAILASSCPSPENFSTDSETPNPDYRSPPRLRRQRSCVGTDNVSGENEDNIKEYPSPPRLMRKEPLDQIPSDVNPVSTPKSNVDEVAGEDEKVYEDVRRKPLSTAREGNDPHSEIRLALVPTGMEDTCDERSALLNDWLDKATSPESNRGSCATPDERTHRNDCLESNPSETKGSPVFPLRRQRSPVAVCGNFWPKRQKNPFKVTSPATNRREFFRTTRYLMRGLSHDMDALTMTRTRHGRSLELRDRLLKRMTSTLADVRSLYTTVIGDDNPVAYVLPITTTETARPTTGEYTPETKENTTAGKSPSVTLTDPDLGEGVLHNTKTAPSMKIRLESFPVHPVCTPTVHIPTTRQIPETNLGPFSMPGLWIYGPQGVGKTHRAVLLGSAVGLYVKDKTLTWQGYDADQRCAIVDDLTDKDRALSSPLITWSSLAPFPVDVGDGLCRNIRPRHVIVTSRISMDDMWGYDPILLRTVRRGFVEVKVGCRQDLSDVRLPYSSKQKQPIDERESSSCCP